MELRPYQAAALEQITALAHAGKRRILLVLPTGGGKTICFSELVRRSVVKQRRSMIIVHRRELVDQTVDKLGRFGVRAGVVMASDARADSSAPCQVCSIQTLARRMNSLPPADLIIVDEAHHCQSNSYREVLALYPHAAIILVTATPWRQDRFGLSDACDAYIVAATPRDLMQIGALVPYDPFAYDAPDLHDVGMVAGDFNQHDLGLACNTSVLVGSIVSEYVKHASGRRAICFPVNVAHSKSLVEQFQAAGVRAKHLDFSTTRELREAILGGLSTGEVQLVSSVGVLTEGFDCPAAEVCILARPTKSLGLYLQMVGRVLRPAAGKERALIHDHAGNILRHGLPDDERDYSPLVTPRRVIDLRTCTDCGYLASAWRPDGTCPKCGSLQQQPIDERICQSCGQSFRGAGECPHCGHKQKARQKNGVDGERIGREQIEEMRARLAKRCRYVTDAQARKVLTATREERAAELLRLREVCKRKGFRDGWVNNAYRETFGAWPRFKDEDLVGIKPATHPFLPLDTLKKQEPQHAPCPECGSAERAYSRVQWQSGAGFHIRERCAKCGCKVNGASGWTPRAIVESAGKTPEALPLDSDPAESLSGFEKLIFHALGVSNG
jgi:superfamily II DNA or RNA helicase